MFELEAGLCEHPAEAFIGSAYPLKGGKVGARKRAPALERILLVEVLEDHKLLEVLVGFRKVGEKRLGVHMMPQETSRKAGRGALKS